MNVMFLPEKIGHTYTHTHRKSKTETVLLGWEDSEEGVSVYM